MKHILQTAIDMAVDAIDGRSDDGLHRLGKDLGADWVALYGANGNGHVRVECWDGKKIQCDVVDESSMRPVRDWASKKKTFCGQVDALPFPIRFSSVGDKSILLVPEYHGHNRWGVSAFAGSRPWRIDALEPISRLLLSLLRQRDFHQDIQKYIREGLVQSCDGLRAHNETMATA